MKEEELRQHAICCLCDRPVGATGIPMFWSVTVERHGIKFGAVRRQDGLAMMLGNNAALASVFSANEEMTQLMHGPIKLTICEDCAMKSQVILKAMEQEG